MIEDAVVDEEQCCVCVSKVCDVGCEEEKKKRKKFGGS